MLEDFLGEGQVAGSPTSVLLYTHTEVVIRAPPGSGSRLVTLRAGGQAPLNELIPTPSSATPSNLLYIPPTILGSAQRVDSMSFSTNGGGYAFLPASSIPLPTYGLYRSSLNPNISATMPSSLQFPLTLPLPNTFLPPTESLRLALTTLGQVCMSFDAPQDAPRSLPICDPSIAPALRSTQGGLQFRVPAGVGVNKSLRIEVWSTDGTLVSVSNTGTYSYDPPIITSSVGNNFVSPLQIFVSTPSADNALSYVLGSEADVRSSAAPGRVDVIVSGLNFGAQAQNRTGWTAEELEVKTFVAGVPCLGSTLDGSLGQPLLSGGLAGGVDRIQCSVSTSALIVGRRNVTVKVAGQYGTAPDNSLPSLFVVCGQGGYGFVGETCLPCPTGAVCPGYSSGPGMFPFLAGVNISAIIANGNFTFVPKSGGGQTKVSTSLPTRVGRFMLDYGTDSSNYGLSYYPIPISGFYNLNGSQNSACPPAMIVPGRDTCVVACIPSESCLGDNICGESYASISPRFRCSSCAKGFYRLNGDCIRCPNNTVAIVICLILFVMFLAFVGW